MNSTTYQCDSRRRIIATAIIVIIATVPAVAQTVNQKSKFSGDAPNPCVGENVPFKGVIHFVEKTTFSDGQIHFNAKDNFHGQGIGSVSQVEYSVGGGTNINGKFPVGPIIFRERLRVVSRSSLENFFATFMFTNSGNGGPSNVKIEADCRG